MIFLDIETVNLSGGSTGSTPDVIYTMPYNAMVYINFTNDNPSSGSGYTETYVKRSKSTGEPSLVFRRFKGNLLSSVPGTELEEQDHTVGSSALLRSGEEIKLHTDQGTWSLTIKLFRLPEEQV
jgi:hypothetical protein